MDNDMRLTVPKTSRSDDDRWAAVQRRDPRADGRFFYSVRTTGVFCRPSCASRPARRENVAFHATAEQALAAGYRPCQRCRPDLPPRGERESALVAKACRAIESAMQPPRLAELAAACGVSAYHFHRMFKRVTGLTPRAYAAARRRDSVQQELSQGAAVTDALYAAGFGSAGRFYEASADMLGMRPSIYRAGGAGEAIWYACGNSSLGRVLVAATARGLCAISLGEDDRLLVSSLKARFSKARFVEPPKAFAAQLRAVLRFLDRPTAGLALPLDVRGTAFQQRVWQALRAIPAGETLSYTQLAAKLRRPNAIRAVAAACAANPLAVVIPCHRVVRSDGALAGYRWGLERKRRLLERERG